MNTCIILEGHWPGIKPKSLVTFVYLLPSVHRFLYLSTKELYVWLKTILREILAYLKKLYSPEAVLLQ